MAGKHSSDDGFNFENIPWKKIGIVVVIILLIAAIGYGIYFGVNTYKNKAKNEDKQQEEVKQEEKMPKQLGGYDILGKIKIENLEIDEYILDSTEDEALEKGVGKLTGNDINGEGNFVIVGHNYEDVFKKLDELEIGNEFYLEDRDEKRTYYKITEIQSVEPTDLAMLLPTEDKTEVTLVTCQTGATTRLVVKAEEAVEIK